MSDFRYKDDDSCFDIMITTFLLTNVRTTTEGWGILGFKHRVGYWSHNVTSIMEPGLPSRRFFSASTLSPVIQTRVGGWSSVHNKNMAPLKGQQPEMKKQESPQIALRGEAFGSGTDAGSRVLLERYRDTKLTERA